MVSNGAAVEEILFEQGLASALAPSALVIDMSSISPVAARRHGELLRERRIDYLDAPVSGGTRGAHDGTLAIMVGGEAAVFERAKPLFAPLGRATRVGDIGTGQLTKLVNQTIVAVTIAAVSEGLLLAEAGGADADAVRRALLGGFADSRILQEHGERMVSRRFEAGGPVKHQLKDLDTVLAVASDLNLELPTATLVQQLYRHLNESDGDLDHSALFKYLAQQNGHPL